MTMFQVYMFTRLDHLIGFLDFWSALLLFAGCGVLTARIVAPFTRAVMCEDSIPTEEEDGKFAAIMATCTKWTKILCTTGIVLAITVRLLPTQKEAAAIYILPKITNSEIVQELPNDLKELYSTAKDYLKGLAPEKE